jgi:hypothetical protein
MLADHTLTHTLFRLWGIGVYALLWVLIGVVPVAAAEEIGPVVINEIHYNPAVKTEPVEFIELYNRSTQTVDLAYWTLDGGIQFYFAPGLSIPAGGFVVIAEDPAALRAKFGVAALGPYEGKLGSEGDEIILRDNNAAVVDTVRYGLGFPWPLTGDAPSQAIELLNPDLDNSRPGHWRASGPTPGTPNAALTANPPPSIEGVTHTPQSPTSADAVRVTALVSDTDGVAGVQLLYQLVAPGAYITLADPAYLTQWTPLAMTNVGGAVYTVELPAEARRHRHLVRYRIWAVDNIGREVTVPYADDPQPNFAYFVYDGVPPWRGAIRPGAGGNAGKVAAYDFAAMRPLPVYHFLATENDVADAQFIPNSTRPSGYMGDDYPWRGTLVYNGQVYDHIGFRARGGIYRYSVGKNMWKFNFNRGHRFQAYDDYGRPYPRQWDKLNFSAIIQHAIREHRGEQGLFESVGFRLLNLAGVEASTTHFVHFRVIDNPHEQESDQYQGDFWGLYLAIEEVDGHFLDTHGLPDGNLYKIDDWTGALNNQGPAAPTDKSDLNAFLNTYTQGTPDAAWWRQNFDLNRYYSYRSILEAIHHYDVDQGKNYVYYRNPQTNQWSVHPWDLDLTWSTQMFGEGAEPLRDRVLPQPEFNLAYQNRLREVRDLLFNPDQVYRLIDEYAAFINTPADGLAMVDADRARWDYNPILISKYTLPDRGELGRFYTKPPSHDFPGMVQLMKDWVVTRGNWIDTELLTDAYIPQTPTASYSGPPNYPADQLVFQTSPFVDPRGGFAALQWRVAEIAWPGLPGYTPNTPNRYEVEATWQSPELTTFTPSVTIPAGACQPGRVCRVRVRMKNNLGRWSHWSAPVEFVAGVPGLAPVNTLKITEFMYHPPKRGFVPDTEFEFIELKNVGTTPIDLTSLHLSAGVEFHFRSGATLAPGQFFVVAENQEWFTYQYGFAPDGIFAKKLNDRTDQITVQDVFSRTLFSVTYQDAAPWPAAADGLGYSLVLNSPSQADDPNNGAHWRASLLIGGSPGADEPAPVVINEVLANPAPGQAVMIELFNPSAGEANVGGWYLSDDSTDALKYRIPAGTVIAPGGYLVLGGEQLRAATTPFVYPPTGGELYLYSAREPGKLSGYQHSVKFSAAPRGVSFGRYVTGAGQEQFPLQSATTLGQANAAPAVGPVVISELMYSSPNGLEFLELTNLTDQTVKLYHPAQPVYTWHLTGVLYEFPSGVEIPPHGKLVVTSLDPARACIDYQVAEGVRVLGPTPLPLLDQGQAIALVQPVDTHGDGTLHYVVADEVAYANLPPWPALNPAGTSIERLTLNAYGNDPLSWRKGTRTNDLIRPAAQGPAVEVCSFDVYYREDGQVEIQWVTHRELAVQGFNIWRSADGVRAHAELVTPTAMAAQAGPTLGASYVLIDAPTEPALTYTYWLEAIGPDSETVDLMYTTPRAPIYHLHFPLAAR